MELNIKCRLCSKTVKLEVDINDYNAWKNGQLIQNAMPYLNSEEREMLISQTCDDCWEKLFV